MKQLILSFCSFLIILSAMAQDTRLTFEIAGLANKSVVVEHYSEKATQIFSGSADAAGKLTITPKLTDYGFYRINLDNGKEVFFIVTGPGEKITMKSDMENLIRDMKVEGSKLNAKYLKVKYQNDSIKGVQAKLEQEPRQLSATPGNDARLQAIADQHTRLQSERLAIVKQFMAENPDALQVLFFTEDVKLEDDPLLYDKMVAALMKKYPDNFYVKDLDRKTKVERVTRIGSIAPDIALPNPDGDTIALSSLRGKVVLLDFWAAWCGPCRRENPNLVRIYNQYKDKGFEIYGVSLDRDRAAWVKGIKDDGLTWTLVSDLKYWSSAPAQLYGVTSIPYAVLLDREGRIIAKKIRAHELEKILAEMFAE
jgi:peroxiredoxin